MAKWLRLDTSGLGEMDIAHWNRVKNALSPAEVSLYRLLRDWGETHDRVDLDAVGQMLGGERARKHLESRGKMSKTLVRATLKGLAEKGLVTLDDAEEQWL